MRITRSHIELATIAQLATLYSVSEATVGNWLAGRSSPSLAILMAAAKRHQMTEAVAVGVLLARCRNFQERDRRRKQLQVYLDAFEMREETTDVA